MLISGIAKSLLKNKKLGQFDLEIAGLSTEIREGNGNPLQYSFLENPMDGGAW